MRGSSTYTSDGRLNTKYQRHRDLTGHGNNRDATKDVDISYSQNNTKEELCLQYIHSFIDQLTDHNISQKKNRRTPFMIAENEFGIKKFVCTTLRPTLVPIPDLYDMYECASFFAGYIIYEPLDPQTDYPKYLFSPTRTLDSNVGDSFDMATLLCSFLLGSGYDAYVVCGYAPRYITLRDQSNTVCPLISETVDESKKTKSSDDSPTINQLDGTSNQNQSEEGVYIPPDNTLKNSKYIADQAEAARIAALDTFKLWIPDADLDEKKMMEEEKESDSKKGIRRVHAWVLVKKGKKEVKETVYIEPTTGRVYNLNSSPYIAVESVWNNSNYWVNNNLNDQKITEASFFDFSNEKHWEQLFLSNDNSVSEKKDDENSDNENDLMDKNNGADGESKVTNIIEQRYFDCPPTWVSPLSITRTRYLLRYPPVGKRSVQYYCAKADFFAKRTNSQCMVMRITLYLDQACTIVKEVHEWFESRMDKMYKRIRYFLDNRRSIEYYTPGSVGEVKKWTEYPGKRIEVDFHVNGRLDRMYRREENIGSSVDEYFEGRTDSLIHRVVQLTTDPIIAGARQFVIPSGTLSPELFVVKMTQEFSADVNAIPGNDISKKVFFVREGKAVFYYHFGKSQITGKIRTFLHTRGPSIPAVTEQAIAQEIGLDDNQEALLEAAALERECFSLIKSSFQQHSEKVVDFRKDFEKEISIEKTVFETALDNVAMRSSVAGSSHDKMHQNELKGMDYLTPFLRNVPDSSKITKEEALEIRQSCLDSLKARLVERANIIQTRLHDENAKLGRKQEQFQRSQREGDLSTEEYEKYCTEAMFRIQILEQRLAAHEETAIKKYADLDIKLSSDPRLKILKH
eukprot:gene4830-6769_t